MDYILFLEISQGLNMLLENFNKFLKYYGKGRYLQLIGFFGLSLVAGFLEFIGVALIYPFIMLIIQPDLINISKYIHFENTLASGLLLGLGVLLIFILKNTYIIFTQYIQFKFTSEWKQDIICKFMEYYIYAPYKQTMQTSVNDKLYTVETLCGQTIDCFVMRILNLLTNIIIIFMVVGLLLIKFTIPAIITMFFICFTLFVQNKYFKKKTEKIGNVLAEKRLAYQTTLLENLNNIKEIKILSSENIFYKKFKNVSNNIIGINIKQGFYASIPPYIVEILIVISLLVMASFLSLQNLNQNSELIASFAIVVAALFRIAPALNRIQSAIIAINTSRNFVKLLNNEHEKYEFEYRFAQESLPKLEFKEKITFENVCFSYNQDKKVIKNISFEINKGDFIGIIGLSGAGKSTIADILTGLLPIDSGRILVDNEELSEQKFQQFRKLIGYVPQQINILDKSIKENIAWGFKEINDEKVIKALETAQLYDVIKEYPEGINSNIIIGSNGLSQGQKQRLAIARALYREPEILILDEATSALDVQVENKITEMLNSIGQTKTIVAIAHRLSTLKACNKLIYLKDGQIVDIGTFEELCGRYSEFNNLVKLSKIE